MNVQSVVMCKEKQAFFYIYVHAVVLLFSFYVMYRVTVRQLVYIYSCSGIYIYMHMYRKTNV